MMPILQRCPSCRNYRPTNAVICKCGADLKSGPRQIYFRARVNGVRYLRAVGNVTIREAEALHREWLMILERPCTPALSNDLRISDMRDQYLNKMTIEGKWIGNPQVFFDRLIEAWGDIRCSEITGAMAQEFQTRLLAMSYTPGKVTRGKARSRTQIEKRQFSPAYVDRHFATYKAAWNICFPEERNPFRAVKLFNKDNKLTRWLTPEEEQKLLDASKKKIRANAPRNFHVIILLAMYTGLRESNILNLHTSEVDFAAGIIRVRQKRDREHVVPMNDVVSENLTSIKPEAEGYFFVNPRTGKPWGRVVKTFEPG